MSITFIVPGPPVGKGRHRTRVISPKSGGKPFAMNYPDEKTVNYENLVKMSFRQIHCGNPKEGPIHLSIIACFPIPASTPKRLSHEMINESYPVTKKPDIDNIAKAIIDGLNGVAFRDDAQVYSIECTKYYSQNPRVVVTMTEQIKIQF